MRVTTCPLLLLDHFGGGAVEGDLDGGQRVGALVGHADIALGAGVGERGVGVAAVRSTSVSYWVSASWRFWASDLAMRPRCPSRRAGPVAHLAAGRPIPSQLMMGVNHRLPAMAGCTTPSGPDTSAVTEMYL